MKRLFLLLAALLVPSLASENEFMNGASSEVSGEAVQQPSYEALSQGSLQAPSVDAGLSSPPLSGAEPTGVPGKESSPGSQQQLNPPNTSPFGSLPNDLKLQILQLVPLKYSSVCHAGNQSTRKSYLTELGRLVADISKCESFSGPEEERDREEKDKILTEIIDVDYNVIVMWDEMTQASCTESESPDLFTRIQGELEKNRMIKMLPMLSSSDPRDRLLDMLKATGGFVGLPLAVRQLIAKRMWPARGSSDPRIGSLYLFLSIFEDRVGEFRDSLLKVDTKIVAGTCIMIVLGKTDRWFGATNRAKLLASIGSLFPEDSLPAMACSLGGIMSLEPSISEISNVIDKLKDPRLATILSTVLQSSPWFVTADWCMGKLERPSLSLKYDSTHCYMLFSDAFREQHGISDVDQSLLLESCTPEDLLKSLPSSLADLDIQSMVMWINGKLDISALAFPDAVIRYSLDEHPDALFKYLPSPQIVDSLTFATIALNLDYARHLKPEKRDALLKHLRPAYASQFNFSSEGDRKTLIANVMSSFKGPLSDAFVCSLSYCDFLLCVEACLDRPEACQLPAQLDDQRKKWAATKLAKYVGDNLNKVANLQKFPEYCQIMVFLLAECEAVATHLSKALDKTRVMLHFVDHWRHSSFQSHSETVRAARRAHTCSQSVLNTL